MLGIFYWILLMIALVFGLWTDWPAPGGTGPTRFRGLGFNPILWLLLVLIGLGLFGNPLAGGPLYAPVR